MCHRCSCKRLVYISWYCPERIIPFLQLDKARTSVGLHKYYGPSGLLLAW